MKKSEDRVTVYIGEELEKTGFSYGLQGEVLNKEISRSLRENKSKNGGIGGGRPDAVFSFTHLDELWFGIVENKSGLEYMHKLDTNELINNLTAKGEPAYRNAINRYALNGAYYYAKNAYKDTDFKNYFVIGACGYEEFGEYKVKISVCIITGETDGYAKKYKDFDNLSFLYPENLAKTMEEVALISLTDGQKEKIREFNETSVAAALSNFNNDTWKRYPFIEAANRIDIVVAMVLTGVGAKSAGVLPLDVSEFCGNTEGTGETDAEIIIKKIKFLLGKRNVPDAKSEQIINKITQTIKFDKRLNIKGYDKYRGQNRPEKRQRLEF